MSDTNGRAARRALPPRDAQPQPGGPRRLAAAPDRVEDTEVTLPRRSLPPTRDERSDAPGTPSRRLSLVAGSLAALAVVTVGALWMSQGGFVAGTTVTAAPTYDRGALLAEPADLLGLREGTTWTISETIPQSRTDGPQPRCLAAVTDTRPKATGSMMRTYAAAAGDPAAALHQVDHYATAEAAAQAYEQRVAQLGACARTTAWLTKAANIGGVSDSAFGASYVLQNAQPEYHTVLVSRSGEDVNILDLTAAAQPWPLESAATGLAALSARQCGLTSTSCPTPAAPTVTLRTPPVTEPPGWLAGVDLPRLSPGAGAWRGTDVAPLKLSGAACEAVDLNNVAGATARQRTYLLHDDSRANGIGIDEAVYVFPSQPEAAALHQQLVTSIDGCAKRTATATVRRSGESANPAVPGASWAITQKVNGDQTARYRVAAVTAGTRVLYLFANPTEAVDFTDESWQATVDRAAERLTQLP